MTGRVMNWGVRQAVAVSTRWIVHRESAILLQLMSEPEGTRRYYDSSAKSYTSYAAGALPPHLAQRIKHFVPAGSLVLDLGCGSGRDLELFDSAGVKAVGVDLSFPLLNQASKRCRAMVIQGDMRKLPISDASADGIVSISSFLHIEKADAPAVVDEICRCLRGGGRLLLTTKTGHGERVAADGRRFINYGVDEIVELLARHRLFADSIHVEAPESDTSWASFEATYSPLV